MSEPDTPSDVVFINDPSDAESDHEEDSFTVVDKRISSKVGFVLRSRHVFVTYPQATAVPDHLEFDKLFVKTVSLLCPIEDAITKKRASFEYYGAQELHEDGAPHYHVVIRFKHQPCIRNARDAFMLFRDREQVTCAVNFITPDKGESVASFLSKTQNYAVKTRPESVFGKYIDPALKRREHFQQIIHSTTPADCESLMREYMSEKWITMNRQLRDFAAARGPPGWQPKHTISKYTKRPWILPPAIQQWYSTNFEQPVNGRYTSLIIVGGSRLGKTEWAQSFGKPDVITSCWCIDAIQDGASHLVVNDVDPARFDNWRDVLGCQVQFHATDKYKSKKLLVFNRPTVWTCNPDLDPRKVPAIAAYLVSSGTVVVDLVQPLYEQKEPLSPPATPSRKRARSPEQDCPLEPVRKRRAPSKKKVSRASID